MTIHLSAQDAVQDPSAHRADMSEFGSNARLLPAPHTAAEKAAMEAALIARSRARSVTRSRVVIGTAAIALAATVPNISLGAMSGTFFSFDKSSASNARDPEEVRGTAPERTAQAFAPLVVRDETEASAQGFTSRSTLGNVDEDLQIAFLEKGSERFDLAFAGVEMPSPLILPVSRRQPGEPAKITGIRASAIRTRTIAIDQIADRPLLAPLTPVGPRPVRSTLSAATNAVRSGEIANQSVEAAFAGAIDVSAEVRGLIPVDRGPAPRLPVPNVPEPRRDEAMRAVPIPAPERDVSASAAAQAVLVPKSKLDARVNGVLTGSVNFRQLDGTIAIELRSVANMLRDRFNAAEFDRLMSGRSIDTFVPLAQLQAAGIPISYNPAYDEVEFGIDYKDAPNASKVQVEQIGAPTVTSESVMIEQIPR